MKNVRMTIWMVVCVMTALATLSSTVSANFAAYGGGLDAESSWRGAVGATVLEDFESYAGGTQIQSLPNLHLTFDELSGGGFPQAYAHGGTPYGLMHLGNFPNGINEINRWNDTVMRPTPGFTMYALGFWNGDGQYDTLVCYAYGPSGELLGSVGAFKDTFAGFISDVSVTWVRFGGNTGDGWNHLDGLQVNAIPEPATLALLGLGGLFLSRRKK